MIVVDTSALMAIVLDEPTAEACASVLATEGRLLISAVTLAEALIVADRRNVGAEMKQLVDGLGLEVTAAGEDAARGVAKSYGIWGKGVHPAALNFGDCFAYHLAKDNGCPLLYVGTDFAMTDIAAAT